MRLIDADALCEGRAENDPVFIAAKCAETIVVEETKEYRALRLQAATVSVEYMKEILKLMEQLKEQQELTSKALRTR